MSDRRPRGLRAFTPGKPPVKRSAAGAAPERPGPDARTVRPERPERDSSVITAALCEDGRRTSTQDSLMETFRELRRHPGGMAWIGLYRPDPAELQFLAAEFDLHPLAVEDALEAHQRPKLERYGDTLFVVLRAARYMDAAEEVDFGELHVFVGRDFVITVRHGAAPDLAAVRARMENSPPYSSAVPRRCCTRSWTRSSTATPPSWRACRTTSTRSRPKSSATPPASRAASTSCPAKWWTSSAPYPFALLLTGVVCAGLYVVFKRRDWL